MPLRSSSERVRRKGCSLGAARGLACELPFSRAIVSDSASSPAEARRETAGAPIRHYGIDSETAIVQVALRRLIRSGT